MALQNQESFWSLRTPDKIFFLLGCCLLVCLSVSFIWGACPSLQAMDFPGSADTSGLSSASAPSPGFVFGPVGQSFSAGPSGSFGHSNEYSAGRFNDSQVGSGSRRVPQSPRVPERKIFSGLNGLLFPNHRGLDNPNNSSDAELRNRNFGPAVSNDSSAGVSEEDRDSRRGSRMGLRNKSASGPAASHANAAANDSPQIRQPASSQNPYSRYQSSASEGSKSKPQGLSGDLSVRSPLAYSDDSYQMPVTANTAVTENATSADNTKVSSVVPTEPMALPEPIVSAEPITSIEPAVSAEPVVLKEPVISPEPIVTVKPKTPTQTENPVLAADKTDSSNASALSEPRVPVAPLGQSVRSRAADATSFDSEIPVRSEAETDRPTLFIPDFSSASESDSEIPLVGPLTNDLSAPTPSKSVAPVVPTGQAVVNPALAPSVPLIDSFESQRTQEIQKVLSKGNRVEEKKDWNLALNFWEKQVRRYPDESLLHERHQKARIHYDISHRIADPSYEQLVNNLTLTETSVILREILAKLQTYYVDSLTWTTISQMGLKEIRIALSDDAFRTQYLSDYPAEQIDKTFSQWLSLLESSSIASEDAVVQCAAWLGQKGKTDFRMPESALALEYLCGIMNGLDIYSAFLTPTQLNDLFNQIDGNFVGLGVELKDTQGMLRIIRTINGSPAQRAGIQPGDIILSVDGKKTSDYSVDKCANMLQGEEGSLVCLEVVHAGEEKIRTVYIVRKHIDVASVENIHFLENSPQTGYLKINNFQKSTVDELDRALDRLHKSGMKRLVIDLRDNPGGLLQSAVEVSNRFVNRGIIVSTRGKNPSEDKVFTASGNRTWNVPLTILIDRNSASAAEIFAGAMRDHQRAQIIGTQSYGKGSVQGIFPLASCDGGVRLTTAKFYSPTGKAYANVGVFPSFEVRRTAKMVSASENQSASVQSEAAANVLSDADSDFGTDDSDLWMPIPEKEDPCIQAAIEAFARQNERLAL